MKMLDVLVIASIFGICILAPSHPKRHREEPKIWKEVAPTNPQTVNIEALESATAIKIFRKSCPDPKILWLERDESGNKPIIRIAYDGKCNVPVAGP